VTVLTLFPLPLVIGRKRQRAKFRKVLGRMLVEDVAAGLVIGTTRKHKHRQRGDKRSPHISPKGKSAAAIGVQLLEQLEANHPNRRCGSNAIAGELEE
jgi:hypothetical protein